MTRAEIVVLGGGPAGLYAALLLARRGVDVTLLERNAELGGLAASFTVGTVRVDYGSHRLHASIEPEILADLGGLLGDRLAWRERHGRIRLGAGWLSFPLRASDAIRSLPATTLLAFAGGAAAATVRRRRHRTFADVVETGLGRPIGERFYYPYARKIWGVEPDLLSGEQARRRIAADSMLALARKSIRGDGRGRGFMYPRGGFGEIPRALARAAAGAGAHIRPRTAAADLVASDGRWRIRTSDGEEVTARHVWSTIPVPALARVVRGVPEDVLAHAARLSYRAMLLVYLVVEQPRCTDFDAHYFPGADVPFTRVSEPKNYRADPADPPTTTVLCAELPCTAQDALWSMDDAALAATTVAALARVGMGVRPVAAMVRRVRHAYPVYSLDYAPALDAIEAWVGSLPGVLTFGRQGLFAHDNTHHALAMARRAVDCLDNGRIHADRWAAALASFRSHVVED